MAWRERRQAALPAIRQNGFREAKVQNAAGAVVMLELGKPFFELFAKVPTNSIFFLALLGGDQGALGEQGFSLRTGCLADSFFQCFLLLPDFLEFRRILAVDMKSRAACVGRVQ